MEGLPMRNILIFGSILFFSVGTQAGELKQRFMDVTSIKEGVYERAQGPESCLEGPLRLLEIDDRLTLMLGAHPLVLGIGKASEFIQEGSCTTKSSTEFSASRVRGVRSEKCKNAAMKFVTDVQFEPQGFTYKRKVYEGAKLRMEETCYLKSTFKNP